MSITKELEKFKKWYETEPFEDFVGPFFIKEIQKIIISLLLNVKNTILMLWVLFMEA